MIIDTKALIKLVDAIGGVTFNVPIDMYYTEDTDQNLYIDLKAGEQLIDGAIKQNNCFDLDTTTMVQHILLVMDNKI